MDEHTADVILAAYDCVELEPVMRTIRAVFHDGKIDPLEPVDLPENTPIRVALLEEDDLPPDAIAKTAAEDQAFRFLDDPQEDIYSITDGEAL